MINSAKNNIKIKYQSALFQGMWMYNTVNFSEPYYHDYIYPRSAIGVGWCIAVLPILPIPFCIVRELLSREGTLKEVSTQLVATEMQVLDFFAVT